MTIEMDKDEIQAADKSINLGLFEMSMVQEGAWSSPQHRSRYVKALRNAEDALNVIRTALQSALSLQNDNLEKQDNLSGVGERQDAQVNSETVDLPRRKMRNPVEQGNKFNDWYQNGYECPKCKGFHLTKKRKQP